MTAMREHYSWTRTLQLIHDDLAFRCAYENKVMTRGTVLRMLLNAGVGVGVRYRLQGFFLSNGMGGIARFLGLMDLILHGSQIDTTARIGGGLCILHPISILIFGDVTIGERCLLLHQNTIGSSPSSISDGAVGPVVIGNDVTFGGGSCVSGNTVVRDGCRIGPNTVVNRSFPSGSILFGVPARTIGKIEPAKD